MQAAATHDEDEQGEDEKAPSGQKLQAVSSVSPATPKGSAKAMTQRPPASMARKYWNCVTASPPSAR